MPFVTGNPIQAFCSTCGDDTEQVVLETWEGQVRRVRCSACDHESAYRRPRSAPAAEDEPKPSAMGKKRRGKAAQPKDEWKEAMAGHEEDAGRGYVPAESYKAGERLDHATFGKGVVQRVIYPRKMEVLFKGGRKVMVCGREI